MVDLTDEQSATHFEGDVERGLVGARHLHSAQWLIHPVVGDLGHGGVEEQRQVDPGDQQDDEAVQRDLAEQERPVRRKDLVELAPQGGRGVISRVETVGCARRGIRRSEVHASHPLTAEAAALRPAEHLLCNVVPQRVVLLRDGVKTRIGTYLPVRSRCLHPASSTAVADLPRALPGCDGSGALGWPAAWRRRPSR